MPRSPLTRRFDRLARERSDALAHQLPAGYPRAAPPGHAARVRRALAVAVAAGIDPADAYPVMLRALAATGIVLRPLHFMPLTVPILIGGLFGLGLLSLALELVAALSVAIPELVPLAEARSLAVGGGAVGLGLIFAATIRLQALRAGLPRWSEL